VLLSIEREVAIGDELALVDAGRSRRRRCIGGFAPAIVGFLRIGQRLGLLFVRRRAQPS